MGGRKDIREYSAVVRILLYLDLGCVYTHTYTHTLKLKSTFLLIFINEESKT